METLNINIVNKSRHELPMYETRLSAGCDLRADIVLPDHVDSVVLRPMQRIIIPTGIYLAIPDGYEAQVRGRSGLNAKYGIICPTGTIDADYRGEIKVVLYNLGDSDFYIHDGDRIAQLVISPVVQAKFNEVADLDTTERGAGGFGSTGIK